MPGSIWRGYAGQTGILLRQVSDSIGWTKEKEMLRPKRGFTFTMDRR